MPLPIAIPPWLKGTDPTAEYMGGLKLGASIAEQQAAANARSQAAQQQAALSQQRLQQQMEITQMELQAKQQVEEMRAQRERQKMLIDASYKQEQLQLQQQKVQESAKAQALKSEIAARRFAAQSQYGQFVQAGGDPMKGLMQFPDMFQNLGQMASAIKATRQPVAAPPPEVISSNGERAWKVTSPDGKVTIHPLKGDDNKSRLKALQDELKRIEASDLWKMGSLGALSKVPKGHEDTKAAFESLAARHKALQDQVDALTQGRQESGPVGGAPHAEGTYLKDKSGRLFTVKNGVPVPLSQDVHPEVSADFEDTGDEEEPSSEE